MNLTLVPAAELPRERLDKFGPQALSLPELLAILLRTGDRERNVLEAASFLLKEFGSLQGLSKASFHEFNVICLLHFIENTKFELWALRYKL